MAGERYTEPVDLTKIDRVPVSIVHSVSDETCDPVMIEWTYAQVQSPDKHIRFEHGGHSLYNYETKSSFVDRMVQTIEFGTITDGASMLSFNSALSGFALMLSLSTLM